MRIMKLFLLTLSTIIFSISLYSDTCYSIRILSLKSNSSANIARQTLQNKYEKNKLFTSIQKQYKLNFTKKKIGEYYVIKLNCFTNTSVLQEVLDIIRVDYKDVFVRKEQRNECAKRLNIQSDKKVKIIYKEVIKEVQTIKVVKVIEHSKVFLFLFLFCFLALIFISYLLYTSKKELVKVNKLLAQKEEQDGFGLEDIDFDDIDFDIDEDFLTDFDDINAH